MAQNNGTSAVSGVVSVTPQQILAGEAYFFDIDNTPKETTWQEIFSAVGRIKAYFQAISRRFAERDELIQQIMYAMMMREHILVTGPTGAAKTSLIQTVFSGINGATVWFMEFTKFTTDTQVFGNYDVRQMKETGQMIHMTEGSLAKANFAQAGEFFDANDAVLRSLLSALNERVVQKGPQIIRLPLLSAVADTNFDSESFSIQRRQTLAAVVDRFLFSVPVNYVQDQKNRIVMLTMSLDAAQSGQLPPVSLDDFVLISGVVRGMNLITDPYVLQAYEHMARIFSEKRKAAGQPPVSDRRFVRGAQILEAAALLNSRKTVTFDDLKISEYILAQSDAEDRKLLDSVRQEILGEWVGKASRREIESELHRIATITRDIPKSPDLAPMSLPELDRLVVQFETAISEIDAFQTDLVEVNKQRINISKELFDTRNAIHLKMLQIFSEQMPAIPDETSNIPVNDLLMFMGQVNMILTGIEGVSPHSDEVQDARSALLDRVTAAKAKLRVAFDLVDTSKLTVPKLSPEPESAEVE